jgi:hypothetical protein
MRRLMPRAGAGLLNDQDEYDLDLQADEEYDWDSALANGANTDSNWEGDTAANAAAAASAADRPIRVMVRALINEFVALLLLCTQVFCYSSMRASSVSLQHIAQLRYYVVSAPYTTAVRLERASRQ